MSRFINTSPYRTVILDSSHWSDILDDCNSLDHKTKERALSFYKELKSIGWLPFLTHVHLMEVLNVNPKQAERRLRTLCKIPHIFWCKGYRDGSLGSYMDIMAAEAIACYDGCKDPQSIIEYCRKFIIARGRASSCLGADIDTIMQQFHPILSEQAKDMMFAVSVINTEFVSPKLTIGDMRGKFVGTQKDISAGRGASFALLSESLKEKGDKRLTDHDALAEAFLLDQFSEYKPGTPALDAMLPFYLSSGIDLS